MSGPHVESHQTTTVLRDDVWWVFCYACQRDIEMYDVDAARAAAPPVEPEWPNVCGWNTRRGDGPLGGECVLPPLHDGPSPPVSMEAPMTDRGEP